MAMFVTLVLATASPVFIPLISPSDTFPPVSAEVVTLFSMPAELVCEMLAAETDGCEKKEEKKSALGRIRSPSQPLKLLKAKRR